ncbi:MAG: phospholipid carrier-dependent glycosyltransferase [Chloroflexi bacterium]|nr:phospholipid carrier-dependent glycosyltransferase [Chloroflexota bacterium]
MRDKIAFALYTVALMLAFVAQHFFAEDRTHYRQALLLYGVAIAVVWVYAFLEGRWSGSPQAEGDLATAASISERSNFTPRRVVLFLSSLVALFFVLTLQRRDMAYPGQVIGWLVSMALLVAACWPYGTPPGTYWRGLKSHWVEVGLVVLIVVLGFVLRAYDLDSIPGGFHGDEGEWAMDAVGILEGRRVPPFGTGWDEHPSLFSYLQATTMKIFGMNVTGVRMLSAIAGALTVLALYLLIRQMFGRWSATVAAFLLAVSHWHIHFSRLAMNDIEVPLFTTLIIYFLYRGLESWRPLDYCLSGMSLGLAFYFGNKSHLLPPLIVLLFLYLIIFGRGFLRHQWRNILVFLIAALLTLAPLGLFYSRYGWEGFLVKRMNDRFIFNNMDRLLAAYGTTDVLDVMRIQTERALLVFNYYSDASGFYGFTQEPVLDFFTAALYVLGFAYSVYRWRDARYALLLCWFGLILQGSLLSIDPPQAHRIIALSPAPFAFAAIAVEQFRGELAKAANLRKALYTALPLALVLGIVAYVNIDAYFVRYAQWWPWLDITTMARYIRELGQDHLIYFFGTPHTYVKHGTIRFIAHGVEGIDVANVADVVPVRQEVDRDVAFVLMGSHLQTLSFIEGYYPAGVLRNFEDAKGRMLFAAYLVGQQEVASKQGLVARCYKGAEVLSGAKEQEQGSKGAEEFILERKDSQISFDWETEPPLSLPYSVRWQGTIHLPSQGSYLMGLDSTQPSRLFIDGSLLVENPGGRQASEVTLAAGPHAITVMGIAASSGDEIALYWRPPGRGEGMVPRYVLTPRSEANGLLGSYYSNADWAGEAALRRVDPLISFRWFHQPQASPFSVRWEGWIHVPESGRYTFETFANGEVWLSIGDQLVLHDDQPVVERWYRSEADLVAGVHKLELRYRYLSGWRLLELYWTRPDGQRELVPTEVFLPKRELVLAPGTETQVPAAGLAWGSQGDAPGQFDDPRDIAVDDQGNVYVADSGNCRVQVFDAAGRFIASWQGGDERFVEPSAVAWDERGYVLVLDSGTGWIHRFTSEGRFLDKFGGPRAGFLCPCWLAVNEAGQVYVLDSGHNRVKLLQPAR